MYAIMEQWRTSPNFPKYEISNLGRVRRISTGRFKKVGVNQKGFAMVSLYREGRIHRAMFARLVMYAFYNGKLPLKDVIFYRDGNKRNCAFHNLYFATHGNKLRKQWANGDFVKRVHPAYFKPGPLNPNWNGGKTYGNKRKQSVSS